MYGVCDTGCRHLSFKATMPAHTCDAFGQLLYPWCSHGHGSTGTYLLDGLWPCIGFELKQYNMLNGHDVKV